MKIVNIDGEYSLNDLRNFNEVSGIFFERLDDFQ